MSKWWLILLTILLAGGVSIISFKIMERNFHPAATTDENGEIHFAAGNSKTDSSGGFYPDLTKAAAIASHQVVHIKVQINQPANTTDYPAGYNNQEQSAPIMASGSGVIISSDGYIITNNHVVEDATTMEVILTDKRTFTAKLIGRDPSTDLALIKIDVSGLSAAKFRNSDSVKIGQWVLAIGYPFSLNTTVTAGIISAKERSIGIIGSHEQGNNADKPAIASSAVEAYIQTDAAINPGNSGGALVNTAGKLIGINAAIASQTGGYEGYGFAIPINLARKITDDLRKFGVVKRGYLGVSFPSPATEDQELKQIGIQPGTITGVYLTDVQPGSAAAAAGLKTGDVIQQIDGNVVGSSVELSERIARYHPEDKVKLTYLRSGKTVNTIATLKPRNPENNNIRSAETSIDEIYNKLGARFAPLNELIKKRFQVSSGMLVTATARGGFFEQVGIPPRSIVVAVNGTEISNPLALDKALSNAASGTIRLACITPDGLRVIFNLSLGT